MDFSSRAEALRCDGRKTLTNNALASRSPKTQSRMWSCGRAD